MNRKALLVVSTLVLLGAGCAADQELVTQVTDQGTRLGALEGQFDEMNTSVAGLTMTIEQLIETEESHTPRFDIAMAQFILDAAAAAPLAHTAREGHHELSETIDGWLGTRLQDTATRVSRLSGAGYHEEIAPRGTGAVAN